VRPEADPRGAVPPAGGRQSWFARAVIALLFAPARAAILSAAAVHFRRLCVLGSPARGARGPVLLAANHPAAWTDVVVLDVALGRRLHFLAMDALFVPWVRGWLLRLFGTLPVADAGDASERAHRNRETFDRCHTLLRRGDAIALFPEGVSAGDRTLRPFHTGAARMLLEHDASGADAPRMIPAAIYYADRTAFRSDVVIALGAPLDVTAHRAGWAAHPEAAAHALTDDLTREIEALLVTAAGIASRIAATRRPAWPARRAWLFVPLAAAGRVLHAPAVALIEACTRRWMATPQQVALGRIGTGLLILPAWGAVLAGLAALFGGIPAALGVVVALPALGWIACLDADHRLARDRAHSGHSGADP
jgi:1-acyl-sn-glycerol-3-phosphate acyltransferase